MCEFGLCGVIKKFFCFYYGVSWNFDGFIDEWLFEYEFLFVCNGNYGFYEVYLVNFEGFIFVNMVDDLILFVEYIDLLLKMFNGIFWKDWYLVLYMCKYLKCNWKIVV